MATARQLSTKSRFGAEFRYRFLTSAPRSLRSVASGRQRITPSCKLLKTLVVVTHDQDLLSPGMRLLKMEDGHIIDDIYVTDDYLNKVKVNEEEAMTELATSGS